MNKTFALAALLLSACAADIEITVGPELSDEELTWSDEDAARLLHTPQPVSAQLTTWDLDRGPDGASAFVYLFNDATPGYQLGSLNPTAGGLRGSVTLPRGGAWRPDVLVLRDGQGGMTVRDVSEVGWQLEVE